MTNSFLKPRWEGIPGLDGEVVHLTTTERIIKFYEKQIAEHEEMLQHHRQRLEELQQEIRTDAYIKLRGPMCEKCDRREKNCYCGAYTSF